MSTVTVLCTTGEGFAHSFSLPHEKKAFMLTGLHCVTNTFENSLEKSGWERAVLTLKSFSFSSAIMGTVWTFATITKQN